MKEEERLSAAGNEVIEKAVLWYEWQSAAPGDISDHVRRDLLRAIEGYLRERDGHAGPE